MTGRPATTAFSASRRSRMAVSLSRQASAPAGKQRLTAVGSSNAVMIAIFACGAARRSWVHKTLVWGTPDSWRSSRISSGLSRLAARSASLAVSTSTTRSTRNASWTSVLSPRRAMGWSSTIRTCISGGNLDAQDGDLVVGEREVEGAAETLGAFTQQAEAGARLDLESCCTWSARAIEVQLGLQGQQDAGLGIAEMGEDSRTLGVLGRVA